MNAILAPGVEIRCSHCGEWHTLAPSDLESTPDANRMLYFTCKGRRFYAGHTDEWRHGYETRGTLKYTGLGCPKCRQPIADLEGEPFADTIVFACPCGHRWTAHPPGTVVQVMDAPRQTLVDRCWCVEVVATGQEIVCGVWRTDAGFEVRSGERDEIIVSPHCDDLAAARAVAADYRVHLVAEVGPVEPLRAWLCGKCAGADVEEHFRTCPHRTTPATEPTEVIDVPSSAEEIEQIAASVGFLLPVDLKGPRQ